MTRIGFLAASPLYFVPRKTGSSKGLRRTFSGDTTVPPVVRMKRWRATGYGVEGISRDTLIRLVDFPELPLRIHTRDTIKAGRSAILVRGEFPIGGRMVSVAYKRVQRRSFGKMLTAWLFGNRTLRTWKMARTFQRLDIPTCAPLLVVVPRWFQPAKPSYLAFEWLDEALNLSSYSKWLKQLSAYQSRLRLHAAAEKLGEVLGKMHAVSVSHRDLKAGNLLLINRPSSVEAFVIDLDGAQRQLWLSRSRRLWELSRLTYAMESNPTVTKTARLRFLKAYLQALGKEPASWKSDWVQLTRLTRKRRSVKSQQGRPKT